MWDIPAETVDFGEDVVDDYQSCEASYAKELESIAKEDKSKTADKENIVPSQDWNVDSKSQGESGAAPSTTSTKGLDVDPQVEGASSEAENIWNASPVDNGEDSFENTDGATKATMQTSGSKGEVCRICKEEGHFARECPKNPGRGGACFNCGEEGHTKAECTKPKVFKGTCRICEKEGHPAVECPDKPPEVCRNCKKEGHIAIDCKAPRAVDYGKYADLDPDTAWEAIKKADKEREMEELREAIYCYVKAVPDTTWSQLEQGFRSQNFKTHIIGLKREVQDNFTIMDLQGNLDQEFCIGLFYSDKPQRAAMKPQWPSSKDENDERLKKAGLPVERGIPRCLNCNQLGHMAKNCKEERVERTNIVTVKCMNCNEEGHRVRDCPKPRKDHFACRNCGASGHKAAECTEPPSAANVECRICNEIGHFAKDCPSKPKETCRNCGEEGHRAKECENPRNPALVVCRNCDEKGHMSKECPKPRDYSRVKCLNCGEMGHTKVRCKNAPKDEEGFGGGGEEGFDSGFGDANVSSEWDDPPDKPESSTAVDTTTFGAGDNTAW